MKRALSYAFLFLMSLSLSTSCQKDKESDIFLSVYPSQTEVEGGSWIQFSLWFKSKDNVLSNCTVMTYNDEHGLSVIDTFSIGMAEYESDYYTIAALATDTIPTDYTFKVRDNAGREADFTYRMIILPTKERKPEELSGIELFADSTGKNNGFVFSTKQPVYTPDTKADFKLTLESGALCFKSDTNVMFVRQNSFDYSAATEQSISNAYVNSIRSASVYSVQQGDVILVGRVISESKEEPSSIIPLGVMKVFITDGKRLIFNIKLINYLSE